MFNSRINETKLYIEKCSNIDKLNSAEKKIILSSIVKLKNLKSTTVNFDETRQDDIDLMFFDINHNLKKIIRKYYNSF